MAASALAKATGGQAGRINAVNLKITLGQVKADRGNLHADGSHFALADSLDTLAAAYRERGIHLTC